MQWALRGGRPSASERKCPGSLRGPAWPWPQPGSGETCPVQCSLCTHPPKLLRPHLTRRLPAQTPAQTAPALTPAPFLRDLRQGPHPGLGDGQLGRISRSPASCWSARNSCSVTVPTRSQAPGHPRCSDRVEGAQCGCEWPAPQSPEGIPGQEGGSPPPPPLLNGSPHTPGRSGRSPKGPLVGEMPRTMQSNRKLICSPSAEDRKKTPAPAERPDRVSLARAQGACRVGSGPRAVDGHRSQSKPASCPHTRAVSPEHLLAPVLVAQATRRLPRPRGSSPASPGYRAATGQQRESCLLALVSRLSRELGWLLEDGGAGQKPRNSTLF